MKKNIKRMLAALALLLLLPVLALADQFAVVKGGRLNLRQYPSASSTSLGKYDSGTWVIAGESNGSGWRSVRTLNGKTGYMSESYLSFAAGGNTGTVKYANGGYVNLRSGPALTYSVVMRVTSGSTVTVVNDDYEWNYVAVYTNGSTNYGYMHDSFIDRGASSSVVTTRNGGKVNVRSGPSSGYPSVGSLASGTKVSVLLKGNGWYMISAGGLTGFMSTSYLSGSGSTIGTNTGNGTVSSTTAYVNNPKSTQVLNLREAPSQSARSIGQYRNGTQVKVVARGATWSEVYVGTRHGYMMTQYLSFTGSYLPASTPVYVYPVTTPTPTPVPQGGSYGNGSYVGTSSAPKAGTAGTLAVAYGSGSTTINVYTSADMQTVLASYPAGTSMKILTYDSSVCLILVNGQVGYVSTMNVNY